MLLTAATLVAVVGTLVVWRETPGGAIALAVLLLLTAALAWQLNPPLGTSVGCLAGLTVVLVRLWNPDLERAAPWSTWLQSIGLVATGFLAGWVGSRETSSGDGPWGPSWDAAPVPAERPARIAPSVIGDHHGPTALGVEIERARRLGDPLAIIAIVIDTHGAAHNRGFDQVQIQAQGGLDRALTALGVAMLKPGALVYRDRPFDLIMVAPGLSRGAAWRFGLDVADRVGAVMVPSDDRHDGRTLSDLADVTIRVAVSVFPYHGATAETLLDGALEAIRLERVGGRGYAFGEPGQRRPAPGLPFTVARPSPPVSNTQVHVH